MNISVVEGVDGNKRTKQGERGRTIRKLIRLIKPIQCHHRVGKILPQQDYLHDSFVSTSATSY